MYMYFYMYIINIFIYVVYKLFLHDIHSVYKLCVNSLYTHT